jgi:hypothetical protein
MFPHIMGILRSPNATIMAVNFTRDVNSNFVTEAHPVRVVTVVCPRENVGSEVVAPQKVIFLHLLKQLQLLGLEF